MTFVTTFLVSFLTHWISEVQNQGLVESNRMNRKSEGLGILGWSDSFETRPGRTPGGLRGCCLQSSLDVDESHR